MTQERKSRTRLWHCVPSQGWVTKILAGSGVWCYEEAQSTTVQWCGVVYRRAA
jgi:hypothetical protein